MLLLEKNRKTEKTEKNREETEKTKKNRYFTKIKPYSFAQFRASLKSSTDKRLNDGEF